MSISPGEFKAALRAWPSGVAVMTSSDGVLHHGMTVSSFTSVSLTPPLVSVCLDEAAETLALLRRSGRMALSVLAEDQAALSNRFASTHEPERRFDGLDFELADNGCALIPGAALHLACTVFALHAAGDHTIVIGEVQQSAVCERRALVYCSGSYGRFVAANQG